MGQTSSSSSTPSSPGTTSRRGEEPGWVDFVGFWLGSLTPLGQQHLPASWEELLTWTDALNSWQLRPLQTTIPELLKGKTVVLSSHDGAAKEAAIEFHPTVDANFTDDVARLPCFSWLDRAIFYHQHVRIQATAQLRHENDAVFADQPPIVLFTVAELGRLYVLGRHVVELEATLRNSTQTNQPSADFTLCAICCTEHENAQLPCGHGLCETCERRWVARKLTCPFCRTRFGSAQKAAHNGWNITEFNPQQLQSDIQTTMNQIHGLWNGIIMRHRQKNQSANEEKCRLLVALPPQLLQTTQGSQDFELINDS